MKDVDAPPAYLEAASMDGVYRPEVMKTIEETLDALDASLRELSLDIHGVYSPYPVWAQDDDDTLFKVTLRSCSRKSG